MNLEMTINIPGGNGTEDPKRIAQTVINMTNNMLRAQEKPEIELVEAKWSQL